MEYLMSKSISKSKLNLKLESKLPNVGTSIFSEMSGLAIKTGAINLSQGFPEFETPSFLKKSANQAITEGKNQYSPANGAPHLLTQIGLLIERQYNKTINPATMVTITSGATEALFVAIQSLVSKDDEVIIFDPAYDSYEPAIELAGGKCIHVALEAPRYKVDWQKVEKCINNKTRAIIINTPHNPTGTLLNQQDLEVLQELVLKNDLFLISDEVYEFITFDNERHESVLHYPDLFERTFIISSFGKTFHCTGWKMGYCVAPEALSVEFRKIHQYVTFCSPTPFQASIAEMLENDFDHVKELANFYQNKRNVLANALKDSKFKVLPSKGTYFLLIDYSKISDLSDREFCHWLTTEKGVATIPLSPFYQTHPNSKVIRLCFAKNDDTLIKAAEILCKL
jgi:methionine aminotransferase